MRASLVMLVLSLAAAVPRMALGAAALCDLPPCTRQEIQRYEHSVVRRLLRNQQARFEAEARGDKMAARHYGRQFERARDRRVALRQAIENAD